MRLPPADTAKTPVLSQSRSGSGPVVLLGSEDLHRYFGHIPDYRRAEDVAPLHSYEIGERLAGGFADVTSAIPTAGKRTYTYRS